MYSQTKYLTHKHRRTRGFTIIELMIVLAIVGLILLIIFLVVPTLQRNSRNYARKHIVDELAAQMDEWATNHGNQYPASPEDRANFEASIPQIQNRYTVIYRDRGQTHTYWPPIDTIAIQFGHWCNRYGDADGLPDDPIAGNEHSRLYVIWTGLEPYDSTLNSYYCVDSRGGVTGGV